MMPGRELERGHLVRLVRGLPVRPSIESEHQQLGARFSSKTIREEVPLPVKS